jgi:hypothetical protein
VHKNPHAKKRLSPTAFHNLETVRHLIGGMPSRATHVIVSIRWVTDLIAIERSTVGVAATIVHTMTVLFTVISLLFLDITVRFSTFATRQLACVFALVFSSPYQFSYHFVWYSNHGLVYIVPHTRTLNLSHYLYPTEVSSLFYLAFVPVLSSLTSYLSVTCVTYRLAITKSLSVSD